MAEVKLYSRPSKDGEKIYAEYYDHVGKRVRKSLNLPSTKVNMAYARKHIVPEIERKIKYGIEARKYKLSEFTCSVIAQAKEEKKRSTWVTYQYAVNKFNKIMGDVNVEDVTIIDIEKYVKALKVAGLESASISLYLSPISQAFNDAIRMGIIVQNPVTLARRPKVQNKEYKVFNLVQIKTLLDRSEGELKTYLHFALFIGARPNEIIGLKWKDVGDARIHIERTKVQRLYENSPKNGKDRYIGIMKPLRDHLSTIERGGKDDYIFTRTYEEIRVSYLKLLKLLGYEKRVLHTLRHTFTSLLYQARENQTMIKDFLGHGSMEMINKKYAHHMEDEFDLKRTESIFASN